MREIVKCIAEGLYLYIYRITRLSLNKAHKQKSIRYIFTCEKSRYVQSASRSRASEYIQILNYIRYLYLSHAGFKQNIEFEFFSIYALNI